MHSIAPDSEYVLTGQDAPIRTDPQEADHMNWIHFLDWKYAHWDASQFIDMFVEVYLHFDNRYIYG